jgi:2-dehydropantoate 2-reductase
MNQDMQIAVIGAGAIGGITAAFLCQSHDVQIVCKYEEKAVQIKEKGLHITGVRGEHFIKMDAVADIEQLSGRKDFIFVVTKAYDMPDAVKRALPFLKSNGLMVSMQNGICVDAMAAIAGAERTVGCVIGWGSTMLPDGTLNMTSEGDFVIGPASRDSDLSGLKQLLEAVMPTRVSNDIVAELYSKMIINACITSLGVLSGLYLGQMLKKRRARNIFIAIIREAMAVADAMGMKVPPYGQKIDYYGLMKGDGFFAEMKRHLIIRVVGIKYRRLKSSSLQSLKRGKPTEIDYFNGYIADKGEKLGINTPVNSRIVSMVKEIEDGKRVSDPENLNDNGLS